MWGDDEIELTSCPRDHVTRDVRGLIRAIDMLDVIPPVAGGFLDQTAAFVDGLEFWRAEESHWYRVNEEKRARKHG